MKTAQFFQKDSPDKNNSLMNFTKKFELFFAAANGLKKICHTICDPYLLKKKCLA